MKPEPMKPATARIPSLVLAAMSLLLAAVVPCQEPFYESELLFPLEHWHNHASCIVECPNGDLLVCWYHGSGERSANDVCVEGARKVRGGKTWRPRFVMADTPDYPDTNPCMFVDPQGRLWLFWQTLFANRWETAITKYRISTDYQRPDGPPAWSWQDMIHVTPANFETDMVEAAERDKPKYAGRILETIAAELYLEKIRAEARDPLKQRLGWMTRVHPYLIPPDKLIVPLYTDGFSLAIMAITTDWGKTWKTSRPLVGFGNIQASLVRKNDGTLVAMMRENGPLERIRISESRDEGMTWGPVGEMALPNPGSSLEVIRLRNGRWMLIYNDTTEGRHSLAVSISDDEGKSWKWTRHLELSRPGGGSYSYPSIIEAGDGTIHATYSYHLSREQVGPNSKSIKHAAFNEAWVLAGDPAGTKAE